MRTITTRDGTLIHYTDWSRGQPVVFSRGWAALIRRVRGPARLRVFRFVPEDGERLRGAVEDRVVFVGDAGHWILEEQPAETAAALLKFL